MQRKLSKILSVVLAIAMLLSASVVFIGATEIVASGRCGDDLTWVLDDEGTLTISGTSLFWDHDSLSYNDYKDQIKKLIVNEGVYDICPQAFRDFDKLEEVKLPSGLIAIGSRAFWDCSSLKKVEIPSCLYGIFEGAFAECSSLTEIELPDHIDMLEQNVFWGTPLKNLRLPANLSAIEHPLCTSLDFGYAIDESNQYFSVDESGTLYNKDKTTLIHHPSMSGVKEFTIPDTVTTIGEGAFLLNVFLEKINIPESVKIIDNSAFDICFMLEELNLPRGIKMSGNFVGYNYNLSKLTIPENFEADENFSSALINGDSILKEFTVYDKDLDFTELYPGFTEAPFASEEAQNLYRTYRAEVYAVHYDAVVLRGKNPDDLTEDDLSVAIPKDDEIWDKNREPDLIINKDGTDIKLYKIHGFTMRCFKGSTAEGYALKYGFDIEYLCDSHIEQVIPGYAASCYEDGLSDKIVCSVCEEVLADHEVIPASHKNENGDGICDECGEMLVNCSHICHKTGFLGFFAKIAVFFWRLFGTNPVCECGMAHY